MANSYRRELQPELQPDPNPSSTPNGPPSSSLGWPFGLPTCIAIHTPSPKFHHSQPSPSVAFHQQFMNLQTTFLLPFFSDAGESSSSDSDYSRSEAASSSFFIDSHRITLGSLIGLPMDHSFHHFDGTTGYQVFATTPRRTIQLPSCGILELLLCGRPNSGSTNRGPGIRASAPDGEIRVSEPDGEIRDSDRDGEIEAVVTASATDRSSGSLAAFLQLGTGDRNGTRHSCDAEDAACERVLDAVSNGSSHSPDWNGQFVSCHSMLSDAAEPDVAFSPNSKSSAKQESIFKLDSKLGQKAAQRMQRSMSVKSFFSSICCRIDAAHRP